METCMAGSVNKVILVGNLGRDPEIKQMPSGGQIANLSIATSENWRDKTSGERKEKTEWHRVVVFSEGLVRIVEQYLKKGSKVYIEGPARNPQMAGQGRQRQILDRSRAAEFQLDADYARRPQRRRRSGPIVTPAAVRLGAARAVRIRAAASGKTSPAAATSTTRSRSKCRFSIPANPATAGAERARQPDFSHLPLCSCGTSV